EYPKVKHSLHHLTHMGKVVGTIAYMAPERALGQPATVQTDIYSLGVILYQMLTLKSPFKRGSLKNFREIMHKEELYNPIEVAPYREVPQSLSAVVLKCLSNNLSERYQNVDQLIHDIETYLEGRSEWFLVAELKIEEKKDWEFQENVLITEHVAITREREVTDWVSLMISKQSFPGNIKIETEVEIEKNAQGFGFLLSVPEKAERIHLTDGYCLWIGTEYSKTTKLLNSTIEVYQAPEVFLEPSKKYRIRIEKIENNIHFYLNDILQFSSISHNPLAGTHIGFISKDTKFSMSPISCYFGSESIEVSCLSVPDAFLAHKEFKTALSEYRRIGYSFPGTAEGREAMFRAGVTLLEEGKEEKDKKKKTNYFELALKEFNKLHGTPGAPLEYLGKALVYQTNRDYEEEIKCFELALRRYPKHPLLHLLYEQITYRMYESSRDNRTVAYNFVLLAIRFIPSITSDLSSRKLFSSLKKNWEPLDFIEEDPDEKEERLIKIASFASILSFWLNKPYTILEAIQHLQKLSKGEKTIANALFCLIQLGNSDLALKEIEELEKIKGTSPDFKLLKIAALAEKEDLEASLKKCFEIFPSILTIKETRVLFFLLNKALFKGKVELTERVLHWLKSYALTEQDQIQADFFLIAAYLMKQKTEKAQDILKGYPLELLNQETTPLHFLYGCWLYLTEGKEIGKIHFSGVLDTAFPRAFALGTHYLNGQLKEDGYWFSHAFTWEKRALYQQLMIFYKTNGDLEKARHFKKLGCVVI
ncbi:MAG TPA: protein kinase, partial [Parachlamydiaceae bacterium]|nr:protein kinase [Parachlamydiaceae bacterium]